MARTLSGDLRRAAAIVGAYEYPRRHAPDQNEWLLTAEVARRALADAGLKPQDVDGYFAAPEGGHLGPGTALLLADYLNLRPNFIGETDVGGASPGYFVNRALLAIQAGLIKCALITYAALPRSHPVPSPDFGLSPVTGSFDELYGLSGIPFYAMLARRYMSLYGATSEQLARVAVTMRKHAALNPEAMFRDPITVEDVLKSPLIASPLHRLDCCVVSDGAAAIVLTSPELARDCRKPPVWVLGFGESTMNHGAGHSDWLDDTRAMIQRASDTAFSISGVTRRDISAAMIYDAFTINVPVDLEGMGFCQPGEGTAFIDEGGIEMGGRLPVNPDGGGMSSNHPGRRGLFLLVEAARQLRHEGGSRQVNDCRLVATVATGAISAARRAAATHILGTD